MTLYIIRQAECPRTVLKGGGFGLSSACVKFNKPVIKKMVSAVKQAIRDKGIAKDDAAIQRIHATMQKDVETGVYNHFFNKDHDDCNHNEDWKPRKGSVVTCLAQQDGIRRMMNDKLIKDIPLMFLPGIEPQLTNDVEAWNQEDAREYPKHLKMQASMYLVAMELATLRAGAFFNRRWNPAALIWQKRLLKKVATRVFGVPSDVLLPGSEQEAFVVETDKGEQRAARRNTDHARELAHISAKKTWKKKEAATAAKASTYKKGGGGRAAKLTKAKPKAKPKATKEKTKKPAKVATNTVATEASVVAEEVTVGMTVSSALPAYTCRSCNTHFPCMQTGVEHEEDCEVFECEFNCGFESTDVTTVEEHESTACGNNSALQLD